MKGSWVVTVAVSVCLIFGAGTALAQIKGDSCNFSGETRHLLTFPYLTDNDEGWWGGMAIINTSGTAIPNDSICLVAIDEAKGVITVVNDEEVDLSLPGNGMTVELSRVIQDGRLAVGVFTNSNVTTEQVRGFGMIGDGTQGQGYLALQGDLVEGSTYLELPYVPEAGTGWWRGLALFNNSGAQVTANFEVHFEDGTEGTLPAKTLAADELDVSLLPDDWTQRAQIVIRATGKIMGFAMFGDNAQAQGLVMPTGPAPAE